MMKVWPAEGRDRSTAAAAAVGRGVKRWTESRWLVEVEEGLEGSKGLKTMGWLRAAAGLVPLMALRPRGPDSWWGERGMEGGRDKRTMWLCQVGCVRVGRTAKCMYTAP